jgi:hypothetical protein
VGSVVHAGTVLAPGTRVGIHCFAVPDPENGALITADVETARAAIAQADFFGRSFGLEQLDQEQLHREAAARLRAEAAAWIDTPHPPA